MNVASGRRFTLGFSPCPNDTFIFDSMVNGKMDTGGLQFDPVLEDVETLNRMAAKEVLDITKLSYHAYLHLADKYILLDSGSALGRGVGPLLLGKQAQNLDQASLEAYLQTARIAIPGKNTTANLLFTLAFPGATNKTEVVFSEIEEQVLNGTFDCGLVIHESRFTYAAKGLHQWMDMGAWWEQTTGAAIPLGGICIRRNIPAEIALRVQNLIRTSLELSWKSYPELSGFVTDNAQEMEPAVMRQHIQLYVNQFTLSLGAEGRHTVQQLFGYAGRRGIVGSVPEPLIMPADAG
jgi:1,4-dihydroxy-6-naphthoate synthase